MRKTMLALDWGTSSLRIYQLDQQGKLLAQRSFPWGIMHLPTPPAPELSRQAAFEQTFLQACSEFLRSAPEQPVLACGMVGSADGWHNTEYLELPVQPDQLARQLSCISCSDGRLVHIVPGLRQSGMLPNLMRGEETQIVGALAQLQASPVQAERYLIGLPGTHSKWVFVEQDEIRHFDSFMTGELFSLLCQHSILGRTMIQASQHYPEAFERGLRTAWSPAGQAGLLSTAFSCRTLQVCGQLGSDQQADYLSGLLIGHELAALRQIAGAALYDTQIVLCGELTLCRRYQQGLQLAGFQNPHILEQVAACGLWQLARLAGLI